MFRDMVYKYYSWPFDNAHSRHEMAASPQLPVALSILLAYFAHGEGQFREFHIWKRAQDHIDLMSALAYALKRRDLLDSKIMVVL